MGNDITVFREGELEKDFRKYYGPDDEGLIEFFMRTFSGFTNHLIQPKRQSYENHELTIPGIEYEHQEVSLYCDGKRVAV